MSCHIYVTYIHPVYTYLVLLSRTVMVLHIPQMTIASHIVAMPLEEEVLWELEDDGEEYEKPADDVVVDVPRESLDSGAVLIDHRRLRPLELRYELGDVVNLRVVVDARPHLTQAQRLVSVVPAVLDIRAVLELLLGWEVEYFLADGELLIYLRLCQTEVDDVEKSWCE
jgi:hypothetical protein